MIRIMETFDRVDVLRTQYTPPTDLGHSSIHVEKHTPDTSSAHTISIHSYTTRSKLLEYHLEPLLGIEDCSRLRSTIIYSRISFMLNLVRCLQVPMRAASDKR